MPTLQIRDLDEAVHRLLAEKARQGKRSLARQAAVTLEQALRARGDGRSRRAALLRRIEESRTEPWPEDLPPAAELVRQDRGR